MVDAIATLLQFEWAQQPEPGVRMKFRRDGTGYYEREGGPGARLIHENLLHRLENGVLHLKFAHARSWTEVSATLQNGGGSPGDRLGLWELTLAQDAYALIFEERATPPLVLLSDRGAALAG